MSAFSAAARLHQRQFLAFVRSAGLDVVVRQPAVAQAPVADADKVLGRRDHAIVGGGVGETTTIVAVVSDLAFATETPSVPRTIAAIAATEKNVVLLRCPLADVLHDPSTKYGRTILDTAKDVLIGDELFVVRATDRTGLPPEGPYICWAALQRAP